jgi:NTE family protein
MGPARQRLAVAMSGGGARAAYQVGVMLSLARQVPELEIPILTGVSAGAINAAWFAGTAGDLREKAERLAGVWRSLTPEQVFRVDVMSLGTNVIRWGARLVSGGTAGAPSVRGLVDTSPLRSLLRRVLDAQQGPITGVRRNLEAGTVRALAITASSYSTGESVTWVSGDAVSMWERPDRRSLTFTPDVEHVMASSALPFVFPAVDIDGRWYGDGGMRLIAPLAPAIHLGADRILAVSTRWDAPSESVPRPAPYPPPAQVAGALLEAIFLDTLDADAIRLEQTNALVAHLPPEHTLGLRKIDLLVVRPSCDIGSLVAEHEPRLPRGLRFLMRGLGTQETRHQSLLSLLMFQPDFLSRIVALGEKDTDARPEIAAFVRGEARA